MIKKMNDIAMVLLSDWKTAQEKVPELAKEILSYFAHKWNGDKEEQKIQEYIQLVWDRKLSSPCYPFSDNPWSSEWEKVKGWYVASLLEQHLNTVVFLDNEYAKGVLQVLENHTSLCFAIVSQEIKDMVSDEAYEKLMEWHMKYHNANCGPFNRHLKKLIDEKHT